MSIIYSVILSFISVISVTLTAEYAMETTGYGHIRFQRIKIIKYRFVVSNFSQMLVLTGFLLFFSDAILDKDMSRDG